MISKEIELDTEKGYYDKYLKDTNINTIGLCFEEQLIDKISPDKNDIRIKKIVTEEGVYNEHK